MAEWKDEIFSHARASPWPSRFLKDKYVNNRFVTGFDIVPFPEPRQQEKRLMRASAFLIHGTLDLHASWRGLQLGGLFLRPQASLLIEGTGCRRPLLFRETNSIAGLTGHNALIVRRSDEGSISFDLLLQNHRKWLCRYRLWLAKPQQDAWLIPSCSDQPYSRFSQIALEPEWQSPFEDAEALSYGLASARASSPLLNRGGADVGSL